MARAIKILISALLVPIALSCAAETSLPDPTRPPESVIHEMGKTKPSSNDPGASLLQTVILRRGAPPAAVIGGELVQLGGRYGEARLIAVSEDNVVLNGPGGKQVLYLVSGVSKTAVEEKPMRKMHGTKP